MILPFPYVRLSDIAVVSENHMRLFSYVVARDYGFAPNPFFGTCTLATCKPQIRKTATVGDWIVGTGSKTKNRQDYLVYVMQVTEVMGYNQYWNCGYFVRKKPNLRGSIKQAFGDNIYFKNRSGKWCQKNSHHSYNDGSPNLANICNDTKADRVLISTNYIYWGGSGPEIPQQFRNYNGYDICAMRGHKSIFPKELVEDFVAWLRSLNISGFQDEPLDWGKWHE